MLKGKGQTIFRIIAGLGFIAGGVKYFISGDYLFGMIFAVAGIAFLVAGFIKKSGRGE